MQPGPERRGTVASDGIFAGFLVHLDAAMAARAPSGSPDIEGAALAAALAAAVADIAALKAGAQGDAADMLEFQIAMLEDEALGTPAMAAIAAGLPADAAWRKALDAEIAGYEASGDEYFRARASDLCDIRDRVLRHLAGPSAGHSGHGGPGAVLFGDDLAPTRFLEADWSQGGAIALRRGSATSHVAMLARSRGIPMVVGLGEVGGEDCRAAIVDAESGVVIFDPPPQVEAEYAGRCEALGSASTADAAFRLLPAQRKDGTAVDLLINVASVEELAHIDPASCDGIGLMRSEFLFSDGKPLPGEEQQYQAYRRLLEWAGGRPVTIRTLDIGGDKPVAGLTPEGERNPFLGLRGIRLTLARPDVFRTQLRALARAAAHGPLKVMIPMVTVPQELAAAATLLDACVADLRQAGMSCARPPLGIMVEVPAVAICPELFAAADFFSIGSNDLTQYVTAASRDEPAVAALNDPAHPAVLRLIGSVAGFAKSAGIPVSLCGDMASEPRHLAALMDAGLTSLSVAPARIGRVKRALAEL